MSEPIRMDSSGSSDDDSFQSALEVPLEDSLYLNTKTTTETETNNNKNNNKNNNDDNNNNNDNEGNTNQKKNMEEEVVWISRKDKEELKMVGSVYVSGDRLVVAATNYGVGIYDVVSKQVVVSPSSSKSCSLAWLCENSRLVSTVYTDDPRTLVHCQILSLNNNKEVAQQSYSHAILRVETHSTSSTNTSTKNTSTNWRSYVLLQNGTIFVHSSILIRSGEKQQHPKIITTLFDTNKESIRSFTVPDKAWMKGWLFDATSQFFVCKYGPTKCQITATATTKQEEEEEEEPTLIETSHSTTVTRFCIISSNQLLCTMDAQGISCHLYHSLPHAIPYHTIQLYRGSKPCPIISTITSLNDDDTIVIWSSHGTIHFFPHWKEEINSGNSTTTKATTSTSMTLGRKIIKSKWKISIPSTQSQRGIITFPNNNTMLVVTTNGTLLGYDLPNHHHPSFAKNDATTSSYSSTISSFLSSSSSTTTTTQPCRVDHILYYGNTEP